MSPPRHISRRLPVPFFPSPPRPHFAPPPCPLFSVATHPHFASPRCPHFACPPRPLFPSPPVTSRLPSPPHCLHVPIPSPPPSLPTVFPPPPRPPDSLGLSPTEEQQAHFDKAHLEASCWAARDDATILAILYLLPSSEQSHFDQEVMAKGLYDVVVLCYFTTTTVSLGHHVLPFLFPELSLFADLILHLHSLDAGLRTAAPELLAVEDLAHSLAAATSTILFEECAPSILASPLATASVATATEVAAVAFGNKGGKKGGKKGGGGGGSGGGGGGSGGGGGGGGGGSGGGGSEGGGSGG
ncbi:unnamed protein product [Closterium sp. NIES-53]